MSFDPVSEHIHSKVSAQDARIGGIETRLGSVETAVTDGFKALNAKLDSNTKPQTFAILSVIGGVVSLVIAAFGIVLSLTVSPLRESDASTAAMMDKRTDITISLLKELSSTKQRTIDTEGRVAAHGFDIRDNEDEISTVKSDISSLKSDISSLSRWLDKADPRVHPKLAE